MEYSRISTIKNFQVPALARLVIFCIVLTIMSCQQVIKQDIKGLAGKTAVAVEGPAIRSLRTGAVKREALIAFLQSADEEAVALRKLLGNEVKYASTKNIQFALNRLGQCFMQGSIPIGVSKREITAAMRSVFGQESSFFKRLEEGIEESTWPYDFILPREILSVKAASPEVNTLALLLEGETFDVVQLQVLATLTGRKFASTLSLENKVYLKALDEGSFVLHTTKGSIQVPSEDLMSQLSNYKTFELIVDNSIVEQPKLLQLIAQAKIPFIKSVSGAISRLCKPSTPVEPIFIISENNRILSKLFDISVKQAKSLKPVVDEIKSNRAYKICDELSNLKTLLATARANGREPLVIFNNLGDGKVLGSTLEELGVSEAITCNSYLITNSGLSSRSTSHLFFPDIYQSLNSAFASNQTSCAQFFTYFESKYVEALSVRNATIERKVTYGLLGVGGGGSGLITYAIAKK